MKLYLLERTDNCNYDEYDSAVVCAHDAADASTMHPGSYLEDPIRRLNGNRYDSWVSKPEMVKVTCIGITADAPTKYGVVCASYNAG